MAVLQLMLCLLRAWNLFPAWDETGYTLWFGPHSPETGYCYVDQLLSKSVGGPDRFYVNDMPKCLYMLQELNRLDLAQQFQDAPATYPLLPLVPQ